MSITNTPARRLVVLSPNSLLISQEAIATSADMVARGGSRGRLHDAQRPVPRGQRGTQDAEDRRRGGGLQVQRGPAESAGAASRAVDAGDARSTSYSSPTRTPASRPWTFISLVFELVRLDAGDLRQAPERWSARPLAAEARLPRARGGTAVRRRRRAELPAHERAAHARPEGGAGDALPPDDAGGVRLVGRRRSPSGSDGIGWEWACFSQFRSGQFQVHWFLLAGRLRSNPVP
ncbi:hypothetical protein CTA2_10928 [Colletotrichum tanaceti]|nr:hypothetical protein CTA2_10928 [Colletotrichum tanaceti]